MDVMIVGKIQETDSPKPRRGEMIVDKKGFLFKVRDKINNPEGMK